MDDVNWADYWWSKITGPREIVASAISALRSKKSAIVVIPHDLPWRHELRRTVRNSLESISGLEELIVDPPIDIEDEGLTTVEPGRFLLERYALRSDRANYRAGGRETIQQYLLRKEVMRNRLIWVKGFGEHSSEQWIEFCSDWRTKNVSDGLFVVETCKAPRSARSKRLEIIRYDDVVGEYDIQLFNSLVLSDSRISRLSDSWKTYAAAITSRLCGADAEIARKFVEVHDFKKGDPLQTIGILAEEESFAKRGSGSHVLALYRSDNTSALRRRIWEGQIEVLFPIIEQWRLRIIDQYYEQFEEQVEIGLNQFGDPVEKPSDIELGTLHYLCVSNRVDMKSSSAKRSVEVLRECRNQLAHRDLCSAEQVAMLLDGAVQ